jgi:hypothetical protein
MDYGGNQFRREGPPTRSRSTWWSRRSETARYLIVGGAAALGAAVLMTYFAWPYIKGAIGGNGHQPHYTYGDAPRMLDPFGLLRGGEDDYDEGPTRHRRPRRGGDYGEAPGRDLLPRGEGDYAEAPGQRLRPPPGAGYMGRYGGAGNADGSPRDHQGRPYRRWRDCDGPPGRNQRCGPWQTGPAPEDGDLPEKGRRP